MATLSDPLYKPNMDEPLCPCINEEQLVLKSREETLMLKSCGNKNYKAQNCPQALNFYTKAILMCPQSLEDQKKFLDASMELLRHTSPAKFAVAKGLYYTVNGAVIKGSVEEDSDFKKELLLAMMPDMTPEIVATPVGPDPLLAQCYGNRSAVLYEMKMFEDSLNDIERALNCGFPSESAHKLEARREKCKAALLKENFSDESSDSSTDDEFPTAHVKRGTVQPDAITVASSPELGRHLKAARDIRAGEVILSEESCVSVLNCKYVTTRCSYCFEIAPASIIPCLQCPCEGYCSAKCRLGAWVKYHWLECKLTSKWRKDAEWTEVMCLRVVASADPADILRACKGLEVTGDYGTICKLFSQESKSYDRQRALLSAAALNLNLCFGEELRKMCSGAGGGELPAELDKPSLKKLLRHHLLQLRYNGHWATDLVDCCPCGAPCTSRRYITSVRYLNLGMVILPTASLMSHSCSPNTHFRFDGKRAFVCAVQAVKKGEELTVAYIPQISRMNTTERREALQEKYFFHCHCPPCQGKDPEFSLRTAAMEGLACTSCSDGAVVERDGGYRCCLCETMLAKDQAQLLLQKVREADKMLETATLGSSSINLKLLLDCRKVQMSVLHKHHFTMARTNDLIAEKYVSLGEYDMATLYLRRSCAAIMATFGKKSIEYGYELTKLATVSFQGSDLRVTARAAAKARDILLIYYGPSHPDYKQMSKTVDAIHSLTPEYLDYLKAQR